MIIGGNHMQQKRSQRIRRRNVRIGTALVAALCTLSIGVIAGSGTGAASSRAHDTAAARAAVSQYLNPARSINVTVPLTRKPPTKTVGWVLPNVEATEVFTPKFQAAASALGWKLIAIPFDSANPAAADAAMNQALSDGVNYIITSGLPSASFPTALPKAKAAGVGVVETNVVNEPGAAAKGIIGCMLCNSVQALWANTRANFITARSGGNANVLFVELPEYPATVLAEKYFAADMKQVCSRCTVSVFQGDITTFETSGLGSSVASYLRAHPSINYVNFSFGEMVDGVPQALSQAGLAGKVKIVTADPDLATVQGIISGTVLGAPAYGVGEVPWAVMDFLARKSLGMNTGVSLHTPIPQWLMTTGKVPSPAAEWQGPATYQTQFKTLWRVR